MPLPRFPHAPAIRQSTLSTRSGILTQLPSDGTEAAVTVMVNGVDTALTVTHRFSIDELDSVNNLTDRVSVNAGDRIALKFEEVGGVCVTRYNQQPGACGYYRASLLLE